MLIDVHHLCLKCWWARQQAMHFIKKCHSHCIMCIRKKPQQLSNFAGVQYHICKICFSLDALTFGMCALEIYCQETSCYCCSCNSDYNVNGVFTMLNKNVLWFKKKTISGSQDTGWNLKYLVITMIFVFVGFGILFINLFTCANIQQCYSGDCKKKGNCEIISKDPITTNVIWDIKSHFHSYIM